jgi:hypothetical protein
MNLVDPLGHLQFNKDDVFDEWVNSIFPRPRSHRTQPVEHRQRATNDPAGQEAKPVLADIHLRVLRVLRFQFSWLQSALEPENLAGCTSAAGSAQRSLSDRAENGTAKHAKGGSALQAQDDPFDRKPRRPEVEQQAEMQA